MDPNHEPKMDELTMVGQVATDGALALSAESTEPGGEPVTREQGHGRGVDDGLHLAHTSDGPPRALAGEELVEDDADGEEVRPLVEVPTQDLLRGHVAELALHVERPGPARAVAREGDAEVPELHLPVRRDEDVVGSDVAVDQTRERALDGRQSAEQRAGHVHRDAVGEPIVRQETGGERPEVEPVDQLEDEEGPRVPVLPEREEGDDVGVADAREQARLLAERAGVLRLDGSGQPLDADQALEAVTDGSRDVDVAERPPAEAPQQLVSHPEVGDVADLFPGHLARVPPHAPPSARQGAVLRLSSGSRLGRR